MQINGLNAAECSIICISSTAASCCPSASHTSCLHLDSGFFILCKYSLFVFLGQKNKVFSLQISELLSYTNFFFFLLEMEISTVFRTWTQCSNLP